MYVLYVQKIYIYIYIYDDGGGDDDDDDDADNDVDDDPYVYRHMYHIHVPVSLGLKSSILDPWIQEDCRALLFLGEFGAGSRLLALAAALKSSGHVASLPSTTKTRFLQVYRAF